MNPMIWMNERIKARFLVACTLGLLSGCGSNSDAGFSQGQPGAGGGGAQSGATSQAGSAGEVSAGTTSTPQAGSGDQSSGGATSAGGPSAGASAAGNAAGGAMSVAGSGGAAQAGSGGVCASSDACTACLCAQCPAQVASCESTPGCQAIAECIASSKCQGVSCYCGSSDTLTCATGNANGPCRDAILNAPGGHKPTLTNQSAGPAADAATALGNCGAKSNTGCTASCQ